jgi:hypothetical protein
MLVDADTELIAPVAVTPVIACGLAIVNEPTAPDADTPERLCVYATDPTAPEAATPDSEIEVVSATDPTAVVELTPVSATVIDGATDPI